METDEPGLFTITSKVTELSTTADVGPEIRSVTRGGKIPVTVREEVELVDPS